MYASTFHFLPAHKELGAAMEIGETLHVTTRKAWRSWLKGHYQSKAEIWLVYHKKESGKPRISYNDAVEEALCFGWIDSTAKKLDEERFAQRPPRSPAAPALKQTGTAPRWRRKGC
jgi:uncharacterized protein YdeI (YjbR/CyaY-like superfamily)